MPRTVLPLVLGLLVLIAGPLALVGGDAVSAQEGDEPRRAEWDIYTVYLGQNTTVRLNQSSTERYNAWTNRQDEILKIALYRTVPERENHTPTWRAMRGDLRERLRTINATHDDTSIYLPPLPHPQDEQATHTYLHSWNNPGTHLVPVYRSSLTDATKQSPNHGIPRASSVSHDIVKVAGEIQGINRTEKFDGVSLAGFDLDEGEALVVLPHQRLAWQSERLGVWTEPDDGYRVIGGIDQGSGKVVQRGVMWLGPHDFADDRPIVGLQPHTEDAPIDARTLALLALALVFIVVAAALYWRYRTPSSEDEEP